MAPVITWLSHLSNPLATPEQLITSISQLDGLPQDLEVSLRYAGARLTQLAGILLRLPQDIIAQAILVFSRFWVGEAGSLLEFGIKVCAALTSSMSLCLTSLGCLCGLALSRCQKLSLAQVATKSHQCLCAARNRGLNFCKTSW